MVAVDLDQQFVLSPSSRGDAARWNDCANLPARSTQPLRSKRRIGVVLADAEFDSETQSHLDIRQTHSERKACNSRRAR